MTICLYSFLLHIVCPWVNSRGFIFFSVNVAVGLVFSVFLRIFASPLRERGLSLGGDPLMAHKVNRLQV